MAKTLTTMRSLLRNKSNQTLTTGNIVWADGEMDAYLRAGVRIVIDRGRYELIGKSHTVSSALTPSVGYVTKPNGYFRFISALIDDDQILSEVYPYGMAKIIENNDVTKSTANLIRLYDYSGEKFAIYPADTTKDVILQYAKDLLDSEFTSDSDISPLTDTGDEYAIEYAYGLVMQSKLFQPEFGASLIAKTLKLIA